MSTSLTNIIDAELQGRVRNYMWRKNPTQTTVSGYWFDLSMSPGNPVPQYYIGAVGTATQLKQSTDGGLYHGANVSPYTKYLRQITTRETIVTPLPMNMICTQQRWLFTRWALSLLSSRLAAAVRSRRMAAIKFLKDLSRSQFGIPRVAATLLWRLPFLPFWNSGALRKSSG